MRIRLAAALSAVAATALLLSGCAGAGNPSASPSPSATSKCMLDSKSGKSSDSVKVSGSGADTTVTIPAGNSIDTDKAAQRTVVSHGKGADIAAGDIVNITYRVVNPADNSVTYTSTYNGEASFPWTFLNNAQQPSVLDIALECQPVGSSVVLTVPGSLLGEGAKSIVIYAQTSALTSTKATGKTVEPAKDMPTVTFAKNGEPSITVTKGLAKPTETVATVLKQGDGATVGAADNVIVQYKGVLWDTGKTFDSSWQRGQMAKFNLGGGVVPGFTKALTGQKVGSSVLAVISPADGYGDKASQAIPANSTLVFVVDILATTANPQAAQ